MPGVPYSKNYTTADRKYLIDRLGGGGIAQSLGLGDALAPTVGDASFDLTAINWDGAAPTSPEEAFNRLATAFKALLDKLDNDGDLAATDWLSAAQP